LAKMEAHKEDLRGTGGVEWRIQNQEKTDLSAARYAVKGGGSKKRRLSAVGVDCKKRTQGAQPYACFKKKKKLKTGEVVNQAISSEGENGEKGSRLRRTTGGWGGGGSTRGSRKLSWRPRTNVRESLHSTTDQERGGQKELARKVKMERKDVLFTNRTEKNKLTRDQKGGKSPCDGSRLAGGDLPQCPQTSRGGCKNDEDKLRKIAHHKWGDTTWETWATS